MLKLRVLGGKELVTDEVIKRLALDKIDVCTVADVKRIKEVLQPILQAGYPIEIVFENDFSLYPSSINLDQLAKWGQTSVSLHQCILPPEGQDETQPYRIRGEQGYFTPCEIIIRRKLDPKEEIKLDETFVIGKMGIVKSMAEDDPEDSESVLRSYQQQLEDLANEYDAPLYDEYKVLWGGLERVCELVKQLNNYKKLLHTLSNLINDDNGYRIEINYDNCHDIMTIQNVNGDELTSQPSLCDGTEDRDIDTFIALLGGLTKNGS